MTWLGGLGLALPALVLLTAAAPVLAEARRRPVDARARRQATGDFAELSDGLTYYQWRGPSRGPIVICVHGLTTPSYVWTPLAEALAQKGFRVLTYDLFGRGLSDRPAGPQDSDFFLRQLTELLADQQITSHFTLMGYSMGGAIATAFAARHPAAVNRLVLLAPAGLGHQLSRFFEFCRRVPVLGDGAMLLLGGIAYRSGLDRPQQIATESPEIPARMRGEMGLRGSLRAVLSSQRHMLAESRDDDHRQLYRTGLPMLAVWGEDDAIIPLATLGRLTQLNRTARQVCLPEADHFLPFTHPRQIMAALSDFLSDASL
ncbi:hypothetical protein U879_16230 [Defluviimonas sp. 20V17]|uniref:Pimeloyl-ACP methyl ester carboxylesterase n=1 Tax=Allgaiera indica TaxID=765699 RepID=A0AAN4ZZE0_9RHOB|nr:alpha/beta hydrolase [Allgaiera indica]KDB02624.1 hypothetical protein U879_16230 [Defluviimonas sp. 20V17]GHE01716.1 hypothetical protein GCM10008024_18430 [Allgaiera indica]SDW94829.1 Pimeloyl-ACP methyl ester carboxylesterase [Allgaiera indica]